MTISNECRAVIGGSGDELDGDWLFHDDHRMALLWTDRTSSAIIDKGEV